jgi:DNA-binding LacI/PurR family transcriptional regulator
MEQTFIKTMLPRQIKKTAESLCLWLNQGNVLVGDKLPGLSTLSKKFGVSVNTVHAAVKHLASEGILETEVGSGTFLTKLPQKISENSSHPFCLTVGLVVWDTDIDGTENFSLEQRQNSGWSLNIIAGVHEGTKELNGTVKLLKVPRELRFSERKDELMAVLKSHAEEVDGFICFPMWYEQKITDFMVGMKKPWVIINPQDHFLTSNHVTPDYYGSSIVVGQLAAKLNAKRVWIVTFDPTWPSNRDRIKGLRDGLIFSNAFTNDFRVVAFSFKEGDNSGTKAMRRQLGSGEKWPDFIYTSGDEVAKGMVELAKENGLVPGKDLSIVSSTGLPNLADYDPPISTVQLPMRETGKVAAAMIYRMKQLELFTIPAKIIPTGLVLRQTTPPQAFDLLEKIRYERLADYQLSAMAFQ